MNKELIIEIAKNKFKGELLETVLNQINTYFELKNSGYVADKKYNLNDDVILNKNHLLHGIGRHSDIVSIFADRGIISQDFLGDDSNHAFCYTSAFWSVKKDISLKEYIENYSGIIAKVNDQYLQVPYGKLDEFVENMKKVDHWLWTAESSMEIRFMPSLARNINQIGFIVNMENELCQKLRDNSIFKSNFNKEYSYEFISGKAKEKFLNEGFNADFFQRADYLIFGVPQNVIEGIVVGRIVENNQDYLNQLKSLFPNCYICNLDGKVIKI
ncbi:MAG: hypothetical protein IJE89_01195 [Bacilli bacterium]|nr:hypothetical protein [Bacilli bacterium]